MAERQILGLSFFVLLLTGFITAGAVYLLKYNQPTILSANLPFPIAPQPKKPSELDRLSLSQKIGQLFIIGFAGTELTSELSQLVKNTHPGGVILLERNIKNPTQVKKLIADLQAIALADTGLPLFVAIDQEGGIVCRLKGKNCQSQASLKNSRQAFGLGFRRGFELAQLGFNLNLAPVLDESKPGDFIYERTFGRDFKAAGELAKGLIQGHKLAGVANAIKHFPGYGQIAYNPEKVQLPMLDKVPATSQFQIAKQAGPAMVMTTNAVYQSLDRNEPFAFSKIGLNYLREKLGQDILIISDDLASPVLKRTYSLEGSVAKAAAAGIDVLLVVGFENPGDGLAAINFIQEAFSNRNFALQKTQLVNQASLREFFTQESSNLTELNRRVKKIIGLKEFLIPHP